VIYKRGEIWWYRIKLSRTDENGTRKQFVVQRSSQTGNRNKARTVRDEHKHALRIGDVEPWEQWPKLKRQEKQVPIVRDFSKRFLSHAEATTKAGTHTFYKSCFENLLAFPALADAKLDAVPGELITSYVKRRRGQKMSTLRINGELRSLRRMFSLAVEWGDIQHAPTIHELPRTEAEKRNGIGVRERVLSHKEEQLYLLHSTANLKDGTILAVDTGLRPNSELFVLEWRDVHLDAVDNCPNGYVHVRAGKTMNAIRNVPLTTRAHNVLLARQEANTQNSPFVFPGVKSGHIVSFQHPHRHAIEAAGLEPFEFYCWRHTFASRNARAGVDKFALCKLLGHSSPSVAERYYIHATAAHVAEGFGKFDSFNSGELLKLQNQTQGQNVTPNVTPTH